MSFPLRFPVSSALRKLTEFDLVPLLRKHVNFSVQLGRSYSLLYFYFRVNYANGVMKWEMKRGLRTVENDIAESLSLSLSLSLPLPLSLSLSLVQVLEFLGRGASWHPILFQLQRT